MNEHVVRKAKQLFDKYLVLASDPKIEQRERTAKEASLFCVNEILNNIEATKLYVKDNAAIKINEDYWNDVKGYLNAL